MDFVERLLGFSPDGGSGNFEAGALLVVTFVISVLVLGGWYPTAWCRRIVNVAKPK
jgi:hypothetical protein